LPRLRFRQPFEQIERFFTGGERDPEKTEFDHFTGAVAEAAAWELALSKIPWAVTTKANGKLSDREDLIHREFPEEKVTATAMFTRLNTPAAAPPRTPPRSTPAPSPADVLPDRIRLGAAWIHRTDDKSLTPLPLAALPAKLCSEVERDLCMLTATPSDTVPLNVVAPAGTGRLEKSMRPDEVSDTLP
jgi:hypothetical protein